MKSNQQNISVIGDGGWGTTLAIHLARKKYPVTLWGPFPDYVQEMKKKRVNAKFLPEIKFPKNITLENDLSLALEKSDFIVFAIPSQYSTQVFRSIKKTKINYSNKIICSVTKGIDTTSLLRISQIAYHELGSKIKFGVLSGPTIAMEVAKQIPSTAVAASHQPAVARKIQQIFNSASFRIYTNDDVAGVEIGGSIKNIIALACGVCDGLQLGTNAKAAIVTRGLSEMARLGKAMGAKQVTFSGLSGLGDLITTCFSPRSRNRTVGEKLGNGKSLKQILASMEMVAEGVDTSKAVYKLSKKLKIDMPISTEVYKILFANKKPAKALADLMNRKTKAE